MPPLRFTDWDLPASIQSLLIHKDGSTPLKFNENLSLQAAPVKTSLDKYHWICNTAAFGIPIIERVVRCLWPLDSPTRELATQACEEIKRLQGILAYLFSQYTVELI